MFPAVCESNNKESDFDQGKSKGRRLAGAIFSCKASKTFTYGTTVICAVWLGKCVRPLMSQVNT